MPNTLGEPSLLEQMKGRQKDARAALATIRESLPSANASQARELRATMDSGNQRLAEIEERIVELEEQEARQQAASHAAVQEGRGTSSWNVTSEPTIYRDPDKDPTSPSFFRDLYRSRNEGDWEAAQRLQRSQLDRPKIEVRALGNTGGVGGSGGEMAPPAWLVDEFVALARPARVTANLLHHNTLLSGVSSVNIPKVSGGTTTAVQTTQNTALSQTDMTTTSLSSPIDTIGGKQVVSQQLLDQSAIPFDRMILQDLAADYAKRLNLQVLTSPGTGNTYRGLAAGAGVGTTAYTTASPKVIDQTTAANSFYYALIRAINAVQTTRFLPPTAVVMTPTRWNWILEALDTTGRPLVLSEGNAFNALGEADSALAAQGRVGTLANLPVYIDPSIPANLGAGNNQDEVFVMRAEDVELWESPIQIESFREPYADSMGVLYRAYAYSAMIPDRYSASVNIIGGTGLVAPTL
jgi:HK97 family phage major capsid protein